MMTLMLAVRETTRLRGVFENSRASFTEKACKSVKRQKLIINPTMITQALSLKFAELSRRDAWGRGGGGKVIIFIAHHCELSSDSNIPIEIRVHSLQPDTEISQIEYKNASGQQNQELHSLS